MPSIDWLYHRKNCITCQRARDFLEKKAVQVKDETNASKDRKGRDEALALARTVNTIVAAKGKKVVTFDMKKAPPSDEELLSVMLGPTGNLRAPTVRKGKTLLIGFNDEVYASALAP